MLRIEIEIAFAIGDLRFAIDFDFYFDFDFEAVATGTDGVTIAMNTGIGRKASPSVRKRFVAGDADGR